MSEPMNIFDERMAVLMDVVTSVVNERFSDEASVAIVVYEEVGDGSQEAAMLIGSYRVKEAGLDPFLMSALEARGVMPIGTAERWLAVRAARRESAAEPLKPV